MSLIYEHPDEFHCAPWLSECRLALILYLCKSKGGLSRWTCSGDEMSQKSFQKGDIKKFHQNRHGVTRALTSVVMVPIFLLDFWLLTPSTGLFNPNS